VNDGPSVLSAQRSLLSGYYSGRGVFLVAIVIVLWISNLRVGRDGQCLSQWIECKREGNSHSELEMGVWYTVFDASLRADIGPSSLVRTPYR